MVTEHGRAELREFYTDPAQPLTIAVGQAFDLVSMPAAVGHTALAALCARRVRLGPVVADSRKSVMRVGFLVPPANSQEVDPHTPEEAGLGLGHAETAALRDWAALLSVLSVLSERSGARAL